MCFLLPSFCDIRCTISIADGEDYISVNQEITFKPNRRRFCLSITILNDREPEGNETLQVSVEELWISTDVIIIDDDGM